MNRVLSNDATAYLAVAQHACCTVTFAVVELLRGKQCCGGSPEPTAREYYVSVLFFIKRSTMIQQIR